MAERDGKKRARKVSLRGEPDALPEKVRRGFVIAGDQAGRAERVYVLLFDRRIEPGRPLDMGDGCKG